MNSFFSFALCVVFAVVYGLVLFKLGQSNKKHRKLLFYILALLPIFLYYLLTIDLLNVVITLIFIQVFWYIFLLIIVERILWIVFLKKSAEHDKIMWFYIILIIPFFGWFLYYVTELR